MSYETSEAVERELEATIMSNNDDLKQLVGISRNFRAGFQYISAYRKLVTVILSEVVEQASLGYNPKEVGHAFDRFTRLLVAQMFC